MDNTLLEIWRYTQVVLGISLVIFVHEAGHFIAARLCKVRVDVFSLGFGAHRSNNQPPAPLHPHPSLTWPWK